MQHEPIIECAFGWGQVFKLYDDHLDARGMRYALSNLTCIYPTYQNVMGIASARLVLAFGKRKLTLRGIAAVDDARHVVEYLTEHYPGVYAPFPACGWRRVRDAAPEDELRPPSYTSQERSVSEDVRPYERTQSIALPREKPDWQRLREELLQRRRERTRFENGEARARAFAHHLKGKGLPTVPVPIHLESGELAYHCTEATLCGERTNEHAPYPERDHGMLILTSKRLIYIGRNCQILLGYDHLLHVSRLRDAVAFLAQHWHRREIFKIHNPLECVLCLEHILLRFRQEEQARVLQHRYTHAYLAAAHSSGNAMPGEEIRIRAGKKTKTLDDRSPSGARNAAEMGGLWRTEKASQMASWKTGGKGRP